ncbi:hypothetical protein Acsp01_37460 [Actinoplanes sp. NBRC 101535]|nr:hypothetical protein Acsp01_37460 [Actinoplanes sp. NBRC 101535]
METDREPAPPPTSPVPPAQAAPPAEPVTRTAPPDDERLATTGEMLIFETDGTGAHGVPRKERERPTVALTAHRPPGVPGVTPLPEVNGSPEVTARLERMEHSPFWLSEEERAVIEARTPDPAPGRRRRPPAHNPVASLLALITLSLVAAFFGWVSAEPFWLAVGHGDRGYATTLACRGDGITQHCTGRFSTADGRLAVPSVTLLGVDAQSRAPGSVSPARMVSAGSTQAYAAPAGPTMHLRWALGFVLVLICGYGIAEATGTRRLDSPSTRRRVVVACFAGPLLLLAGFLVAAY